MVTYGNINKMNNFDKKISEIFGIQNGACPWVWSSEAASVSESAQKGCAFRGGHI